MMSYLKKVRMSYARIIDVSLKTRFHDITPRDADNHSVGFWFWLR